MDFEFFLLFAGEVYGTAFNDISAFLLGFFIAAFALAAVFKIILSVRANW